MKHDHTQTARLLLEALGQYDSDLREVGYQFARESLAYRLTYTDPLWPLGIDRIREMAEAVIAAEEELRDLCNAVFRIGWDRTQEDVRRHAEEIVAEMDRTPAAQEPTT
jgi:hypothetical protein